MQFTLPDSMESKNQSTSATPHEDQTQEIKAEFVDAPSDRESSIESFHTNKSELSIPTETELIDVDDIELSDEESWLYKSPKKLTSDEKALSTYKWLHKDVEEMDNLELYVTKNALVSKLNQLKMLNADVEKRLTKEKTTTSQDQICEQKTAVMPPDEISTKAKDNPQNQDQVAGGLKLDEEPKSNKSSGNDVLDVMDVHEIARLQEEQLKQSTSRFRSETDISGKQISQDNIMTPGISVQNVGLVKPASVEALNTCNGKINHSGVYGLSPTQGIKQQHMFGSSASLNRNQDLYRGSLPNINRGYYSLRTRKLKHPSDQKLPCPLPVYPTHPKVTVNGTTNELPFESQTKMTSPPCAYRESRTLPSSYRVNSRSKSRRDLNALSPSPRRESAPFLSGQKGNTISEVNRRDSVPSNHRKFLSPVSSPTLYQRCSASSPVLQSPTKALNSFQTMKTPPNVEYHRNASHSPSRRLPLNPVQNQSPKRGNSPASPRNGEFRTLKLPSKIPSPASRSGIPVPSMPYISRANADDDSWSEDCF